MVLKVREDTAIERLQQRIEQRFPDVTATTSQDFEQKAEWMQYVRVFTWVVSMIAVLTT